MDDSSEIQVTRCVRGGWTRLRSGKKQNNSYISMRELNEGGLEERRCGLEERCCGLEERCCGEEMLSGGAMRRRYSEGL